MTFEEEIVREADIAIQSLNSENKSPLILLWRLIAEIKGRAENKEEESIDLKICDCKLLCSFYNQTADICRHKHCYEHCIHYKDKI